MEEFINYSINDFIKEIKELREERDKFRDQRDEFEQEVIDGNDFHDKEIKSLKDTCKDVEQYLRLEMKINYQCDWPAPILRKFSEKLKGL